MIEPHVNLVPRVFVPLDQRSENKSSGSNHFEVTKEIAKFHCAVCIYGACLKWLLPELSFSDRWSRGTKTLETRLTTCKSDGHAQFNRKFIESEVVRYEVDDKQTTFRHISCSNVYVVFEDLIN